ncbi:galactokinase [Mycetocola miduiensis]|uniref:Galactokinase n=1 Tax=Mycetocola miduiensis TaxID=995034 RepID=A0A1I5D8F7_9MICO|nr:galactokinase [Mycetocola miduiensis]SFN95417.1 galactokinase [Mycetocola miduiensis]
MSELSTRARAGFEERFEREPLGVWRAPGRVNLIGEHTDYNDGFVFPFAIDRSTVVALALRQDRTIQITTAHSEDVIRIGLDDVAPDAVSGWSAYPLGVVWALGEFGADLSGVAGFDAHIDSDVPIGAGLSSSAAIESAVAVALNEVWDLGFDRQLLARVGQLAENKAVGAPTGIMDQSASLLGQKDAAVFLDCRSLDAEVIPLGFEAAGLVLLVINTHVSHSHATGGYADRRESCERGAREMGVSSLRDLDVDDLDRASAVLDAETLRRIRHVITEDQRVLDTVRTLRLSGPEAIGDLLTASHASMRDDFEISVPELDVAVDSALAAGAIGARMTGGGFGGAAIALVRTTELSAVSDAVLAAFARNGFETPDLFTVTAADGASRAD